MLTATVAASLHLGVVGRVTFVLLLTFHWAFELSNPLFQSLILLLELVILSGNLGQSGLLHLFGLLLLSDLSLATASFGVDLHQLHSLSMFQTKKGYHDHSLTQGGRFAPMLS